MRGKFQFKLSNRLIISIYIVCVLLMVIASFNDFAISSVLYNKTNWFGIVLCCYGEAPMDILVLAMGAMLIACHNKDLKGWKYFQLILGGIFTVLGMILLYVMPLDYFEQCDIYNATVFVIVVDVVLSVATFVFFYRLAQSADRKDVMQLVLVYFTVTVLALVIVNVIKIPWSRPRMRLISSRDDVTFQSWWQFGNAVKDELMSLGVASEEFKSFPSGHTANATLSLLFSFVAYLSPKFQSLSKPMFYGGLVYSAAVALSRIIRGAHFLSDVTMGFTITFTLVLLAMRYMNKKTAKE